MARYWAVTIGGGILATLCVGASALGQTTHPEAYTPAATTDARVGTINNGLVTFDAPSHPGIRFTTIRRDRDGEAEVHGLANEHIYILEGVLDYEVGDTLSGDRITAPNERRGGEIAGGRRYTLRPGDSMYVPAGVPHRVRLAPGTTSVRYIGVKNNSPPATPGAATTTPR